MNKCCLTVTCATARGIVSEISTFLAKNGCNIIDSAMFDDLQTGQLFMRVSFASETGASLAVWHKNFADIGARHGMQFAFHDEAKKMKVLVMVSRFGHCLNNLLYRVRIDALPIEVVAVISNHRDYQKVVVN